MEEATTTETAAPETAVTETAAPPQSFIETDGTFKEGWQDVYLTEDQRANARVAGGRVTSVQNLLDTVINSDKMISGDKILKPSDSFGDEDWDAYHRAGGFTGEVIPMVAPEGLPDGVWSDDRATAFSTLFNELKLSPKQQAGIAEAYNADLAQQVTDMGNDNETNSAAVKAELLAEKGNAYTQFMHNGNFAVEKGMDDADHKQRVIDKFGSDVDFIRMMGNLGSQFNESGSVPTAAMADTPADKMTQINAIHASEAFLKPLHPDHKSTMATLTRLYAENANIKQPA
jgi:hypothetical protein